MTKHYYTYLALGDSYSVGENIPLYESFPYQLVQLQRAKGLHMHAPEIVAKTGWTSTELAAQLLHLHLSEQYDLVTLLVGVNNQYRKLELDEYRADFEYLLKKAIHFTGNTPGKVVVLSIPDWGVTPHAEGSDIQATATDIDRFNAVNAALARQYQVQYIDITPGTREMCNDLSLVAADGLHPSGKEYARWAARIAALLPAANQ